MIAPGPEAPGAIGPATEWIASGLTGSVAVTLAVLGIASIGFAMLTGNLAVRRGVATLAGCFVFFGAAVVARSLLGVAGAQSKSASVVEQSNLFAPLPPTLPKIEEQRPADPYAGAALSN